MNIKAFHCRGNLLAHGLRGRWSGSRSVAGGSWLAAALVFTVGLCPAQESHRNSIAGAAAVEARRLHPESQPYTFKSGDLRLLVTPSLEMDWNDNVNLSEKDALEDFILRPLLQFEGSYPITQRNLLRFSVGVGYDQYLSHDEFSALRLVSGSEVAFDLYIKDFWINIHDRFEFVQDPAEQASVAATGRYGGLDNTAGLSTTWDLKDLVLTLGYDHENFIASSEAFDYLNRASELLLGRAGFRLHPRVTAGVEAGGSFTTYEQDFLNDSQGYSAGVFADWRPGPYFRIQARGGYCALLFDQTSQSITAKDQDTFYAGLTVGHEITEAVSYSLSGGHELRLGTDADSIEDWYVRPAIDWHVIKNLIFSTYLSYEHGEQGQRDQAGAVGETYDWLGAGLGLSHPITKKLSFMLKYRVTLRSSDVASRDYTQNLVGLRLTYQFE